VTSQHPNKPFMVSEWGVFDYAADPTQKAATYAKVLEQLKALPAIKGLMYFDAANAPGAPGDLRVNSSPGSLTEFRKIAADPTFQRQGQVIGSIPQEGAPLTAYTVSGAPSSSSGEGYRRSGRPATDPLPGGTVRAPTAADRYGQPIGTRSRPRRQRPSTPGGTAAMRHAHKRFAVVVALPAVSAPIGAGAPTGRAGSLLSWALTA
jgi:hypothetical protein